MADYECWPLWREDIVGNVDPASLAISPQLRERLARWARHFDETLDQSDPASSGFSSIEAEAAFEHEGRTLSIELQRELGDEATVCYWRDTR